MVELVLGDPRRKAVELDRDRVALLVARLEANAHRALDRDDDALHRETALVVLAALLGALHDRGVDERAGLLLVLGLDHEDAAEHADLVRGQPHSPGVLHQARHALDELLEIVVEVLHLLGLEPEHRIWVLANLGQGETTFGFGLRIELVGLDLALLGHVFEFSQTLCGSTSTTAIRSAARIALEAEPSRRAARDATSRGRSVFTISWARCFPRRRKSAAGPSSSPGASASPSASSVSACIASSRSGPETRMRTRWRYGGYPRSRRRFSSPLRNPSTSCRTASATARDSG